jgi:hypothetical protein
MCKQHDDPSVFFLSTGLHWLLSVLSSPAVELDYALMCEKFLLLFCHPSVVPILLYIYGMSSDPDKFFRACEE